MLRVLVIEDEPAYVEAIEVALANEGFDVERGTGWTFGL